MKRFITTLGLFLLLSPTVACFGVIRSAWAVQCAGTGFVKGTNPQACATPGLSGGAAFFSKTVTLSPTATNGVILNPNYGVSQTFVPDSGFTHFIPISIEFANTGINTNKANDTGIYSPNGTTISFTGSNITFPPITGTTRACWVEHDGITMFCENDTVGVFTAAGGLASGSINKTTGAWIMTFTSGQAPSGNGLMGLQYTGTAVTFGNGESLIWNGVATLLNSTTTTTTGSASNDTLLLENTTVTLESPDTAAWAHLFPTPVNYINSPGLPPVPTQLAVKLTSSIDSSTGSSVVRFTAFELP